MAPLLEKKPPFFASPGTMRSLAPAWEKTGVAARVARKPGRIRMRLPDAKIECRNVQAPRESGKCPMSLLLMFRHSRSWQHPMLGGRI